MSKIDMFQRFLDAQASVYEDVIKELTAAQKTGHWMWFIFPQHVKLGSSDRAKRYGLYGVEQAREYIVHPVLGTRLRECCELMLEHHDKPVAEILGELDALKLRSSLTLFQAAAPSEKLFSDLIDAFYSGKADPLTLDLIQTK